MRKSLIYVLSTVLCLYGCQCNNNQKTANPEDKPVAEAVKTTDGFLNASKLGGIVSPVNIAQYAIVVGAYHQEEYANKKAELLSEEQGYAPTIVQFHDGMLAVALFPSDDKDATIKKAEELKAAGICPVDGWILIND